MCDVFKEEALALVDLAKIKKMKAKQVKKRNRKIKSERIQRRIKEKQQQVEDDLAKLSP